MQLDLWKNLMRKQLAFMTCELFFAVEYIYYLGKAIYGIISRIKYERNYFTRWLWKSD